MLILPADFKSRCALGSRAARSAPAFLPARHTGLAGGAAAASVVWVGCGMASAGVAALGPAATGRRSEAFTLGVLVLCHCWRIRVALSGCMCGVGVDARSWELGAAGDMGVWWARQSSPCAPFCRMPDFVRPLP